jgi:hypothetical protein
VLSSHVARRAAARLVALRRFETSEGPRKDRFLGGCLTRARKFSSRLRLVSVLPPSLFCVPNSCAARFGSYVCAAHPPPQPALARQELTGPIRPKLSFWWAMTCVAPTGTASSATLWWEAVA